MTKRSHTRVRRLVSAVSAAGILLMGGIAPAAMSQTTTESTVAEELTWQEIEPSETSPAPTSSEPSTTPSSTASSTAASSASTPSSTQKKAELTEPELAEDVTLTHLGTTEDGLEEYKLEATVAFPAGDEEGYAEQIDDIKLMRTSGELDIQEVTSPEVEGLELDDADVTLFDFPDEDTEELAEDLPADLVGDVIAFDVADTLLPEVSTFSATVLATEPASEDVAWELYRGAMPEPTVMLRSAVEQPTTIDPRSPVPSGYARLVVQVAGDHLLGGTNNATWASGRQDSVFMSSPGEGAVLRLYESEKSTSPIDESWASCTADSNGECVFDVPANGKRYWVAMEEATPGYSVQKEIRVGPSGNSQWTGGKTLRYAYETPTLRAGKTFYSGTRYGSLGNVSGAGTQPFMSNTGSSANRSSLGAFQQVRENPSVQHKCQAPRVGFVIDTSGSMGRRGMKTMSSALGQVVNSLADTRTEVGFVTFDDNSPGAMPENVTTPYLLSDKNQLAQAKKWIADLGKKSVFRATNWEAGLLEFAKYNAANPGSEYDMVYMITDGNPTARGTGRDDYLDGDSTEFKDLEGGIAAANALKSQGTHIVAVAIPSNWGGTVDADQELEISEHNLQAISGSLDNNGRSLRAADFAKMRSSAEFVTALQNALRQCDITVERRFYKGNDPRFVPSPENTLPTKEESKNWPFTFKGKPKGQTQEAEVSVTPKEVEGRDNLVARYDLNGISDYEFVDIAEDPQFVPEGWVPLRVESGKNAEGRCGGTEDLRSQDDNIEDIASGDTQKTNDFKAKNIPLIGGCHYIVYYMKVDPRFTFLLGKVDADDNETPLEDAEFTLEGLDEDNKDVNSAVSTGAEGIASWGKLKYGRYKLSETRVPIGGYSLLLEPIYFRVDHDGKNTKLYVLKDADDTTGTEVTNPEEILTFPVVNFTHQPSEGDSRTVHVAMTIANTKAGDLPATGGRGLLWPTFGGMLVILVGWAMARRRTTP